MKTMFNYMICTAALLVAVLLVLGGGFWSLCGLAWCGVLYVSGILYPRFWRAFWVTNIRILSYFNCL